MFSLNKKMFSISSKANDNSQPPLIAEKTSIIIPKDWGRDRAKALDGSEVGLKVCVKKLYEIHKDNLRRDLQEQEQAKLPFFNKLHDLESQKKQLECNIQNISDNKIPSIKHSIDKSNAEILNIKNNPASYLNDKVDKAGFYIGSIILLFLTIYLFVFYSSASYSAFFKTFTLSNLGVANSIFDPQAISKAFTDGTTELVLILTIPFVFIGLGYLIHKFLEGKSWTKYFKIAMLILVTFVFDTILAYEITEKIYNITAMNSFKTMPEYTLSFAFQSINFWMVIFAGFVVYIIWGFVFDFFLDSLGKLDKISNLIKEENKKIAKFNNEINTLTNELNQLKNDYLNVDKEINILKTRISASEIFKPKELQKTLYDFLDGWLEWLTSDQKGPDDHEKATRVVEAFVVEHIESLNLINSN